MLSLVLSAAKSGTLNDEIDEAFLIKHNALSVRDNLLMKTIARNRLWWPGIDEAIDEFVHAGKMCQEYAPAPPSQFVPFSPASKWDVDYTKINEKDAWLW
ncbi:unnamed protein product [Lepeophtheirus salmonis]|uniref:(salmon louse) hypothetical protein n=1 Tax=Lepeophtheirus salmonis TaxID=72036 RepID=A0A7R8H9M2_LEPSM|nr:unnamed protein product [Lepeophtheirus salmonis]CAF2951816.1 unnamed protein product [Lepeophtheirus salmonis]